MANRLGIDLTGKTVVVAVVDDVHTGSPLFTVSDTSPGFGADPGTAGTKVFGRWRDTGQRDCVRGYAIERLATEEEIAAHPLPALCPICTHLPCDITQYITGATEIDDMGTVWHERVPVACLCACHASARDEMAGVS